MPAQSYEWPEALCCSCKQLSKINKSSSIYAGIFTSFKLNKREQVFQKKSLIGSVKENLFKDCSDTGAKLLKMIYSTNLHSPWPKKR